MANSAIASQASARNCETQGRVSNPSASQEAPVQGLGDSPTYPHNAWPRRRAVEEHSANEEGRTE